MSQLEIKNLHVSVEGKEILKGVDLTVERGETVFLVGRLSSDERGSLTVSRMYVDTLRPLLTRLQAEVAARPELLTSDVERGFFEHALATSP